MLQVQMDHKNHFFVRTISSSMSLRRSMSLSASARASLVAADEEPASVRVKRGRGLPILSSPICRCDGGERDSCGDGGCMATQAIKGREAYLLRLVTASEPPSFLRPTPWVLVPATISVP